MPAKGQCPPLRPERLLATGRQGRSVTPLARVSCLTSAGVVIEAYYHTTSVQICFGVVHSMLAKVKNGRCQHRISPACDEPLVEMLQTPDPTRGNHRDTHRISNTA